MDCFLYFNAVRYLAGFENIVESMPFVQVYLLGF